MNSYFEGWYFKQQNQTETVALIPAVYTGRDGRRCASLQIITDDGSYFTQLNENTSFLNRRRLAGQVGGSGFFGGGVILDVDTEDIKAEGRLKFGRLSPVCGDIMGPFRFLPFMECRHSVMSMIHSVNGSLRINEREYEFQNGMGYIEGDRGKSFPERYIWTHCCEDGVSVMLAAADIPVFTSCFRGIIGAVHMNGIEYRFATYLGAKAAKISEKRMCVFQEGFMLSVDIFEHDAQKLSAPTEGMMTRTIKESPSCRARYVLKKGNKTLFDFTSSRASFEYEWNAT